MNAEKQRIANEIFTEEGMPYSRLKKEFLKANYKIEVKDPLHWIISKTVDNIPIVLDVTIGTKYPHSFPQVVVLSPKVFIFRGENSWGPSKTLDNLFSLVLNTLQSYRPPESVAPPPSVQAVIDLVKRTEKPVHLVLGSHPGEDTVGRTIYSNPNIFLLDTVPGSGDISRFFNIDFTNLQEMNWLCSQLPGAFEAIILDASTMKFFTPYPYTSQDQLKFLDILSCLQTLLSDNGIFFIPEYTSGYGGIMAMKQVVNESGKLVSVRDYSLRPNQIMKEMVESVGFQTELKGKDELNHPLVKMVHKDRTDRNGSSEFLVATKAKRGGRRKATRRKLKRRKSTKRR